MNSLTIFALLLVAVACIGYATARPEDKYTTKYDNIDVDQIVANERLLKNYTNCLLEKGKCSKDGEELKRVLPEALKTNCAKCSDKQKEGTKKIISHLYKNKKDIYAELQAKYDPEHIYETKYADDLKKL